MKTFIKYLITLGFGALLSFYVMSVWDLFDKTNPAEIFHILHNSFLFPGVMLAGLGLLVFVSNEGVFDILTFGTKQFFSFFRKKKSKKYADFYEYKEARAQKKLKFGSILICGTVYIVASVVMLILYHQYI